MSTRLFEAFAVGVIVLALAAAILSPGLLSGHLQPPQLFSTVI